MKQFSKIVLSLVIFSLIFSVFCVPASADAGVISLDMNKDESFDIRDLVCLKKAMVASAEGSFDLNGDAIVNSDDLIILRHACFGEYAVVYRAFSDQYALQYYHAGDEVVPPANPFYNSWTFAGWDGLPETASENIVIINALFSKNYDFPIIR
ncbi:MAG: hypothetical protein IKI29_06300 [Clostridia bacterium]|nr:hypothetical protein [Clostridia bacterium]